MTTLQLYKTNNTRNVKIFRKRKLKRRNFQLDLFYYLLTTDTLCISIFYPLFSDTLIKDWRSRHIFMVYDLQLCVHNILVLLYDFSSILNPIFEASIIKSQIFITQFLKTSLCNLDSPARSDKGANV